MGERPEGAGAAGALILSGVGAGEVVGRERAPLFRPGRGNREGDAGGGESGLGRLGRGGSGVVAQFGPGCSGGTGLLLFFLFLFCFVFCFPFICLFPFLFYFI